MNHKHIRKSSSYVLNILYNFEKCFLIIIKYHSVVNYTLFIILLSIDLLKSLYFLCANNFFSENIFYSYALIGKIYAKILELKLRLELVLIFKLVCSVNEITSENQFKIMIKHKNIPFLTEKCMF